jgi:hypothetical protein
VTDSQNQASAIERSNHDTDPQACADPADLRGREALHLTPNAQERPLQGITHLHEPETKEECKQSRQGRALFGLHGSEFITGLFPK